jgi:hypothetical protein
MKEVGAGCDHQGDVPVMTYHKYRDGCIVVVPRQPIAPNVRDGRAKNKNSSRNQIIVAGRIFI